MKTKASRRPFSDPFDEMGDEALEREVLEALEQGTTKISLRVPNELLGRTRQARARPKAGAVHRRTRGARRGGAKG